MDVAVFFDVFNGVFYVAKFIGDFIEIPAFRILQGFFDIVEFILIGDFHHAGLKFTRHASGLANIFGNSTQHARHVFGADHQHQDKTNHDKFLPT